MDMPSSCGVIFDMDGVIVNSMPIHEHAWKEFLRRHGIAIDDAALRRQIYGRLGEEIVRDLFSPQPKEIEVESLVKEKDALYRGMFVHDVTATEGLEVFLKTLEAEGIPCAIATAAPPENVDFILGKTGLHKYFPIVVDASMVATGKPDPEVFLIAAERLKIPPSRCTVFEDSLMGIEAARRTGMRVIALTTTHPAEELGHADRIVPDFTTVTVVMIHDIVFASA